MKGLKTHYSFCGGNLQVKTDLKNKGRRKGEGEGKEEEVSQRKGGEGMIKEGRKGISKTKHTVFKDVLGR